MDGGTVPQSFTASDLPVGAEVVALKRVLFCHGAVIDGDEGPIEFSFSDGSTWLFESGGNGEDLHVKNSPWQDPFMDPISEENVSFLLDSGKWEIFNLGLASWSYRRFVGLKLRSARMSSANSVCLHFDCGNIEVTSGGDELRVDFIRP